MLLHGQRQPRSVVAVVLVGLVVTVAVIHAVPCEVSTPAQGQQQLECRQRRMTRLPDHRYDGSTLVWLDMAGNYLTSLTGLNAPRFRQLRHLDVSHNRLTSLTAGVLSGLRQLQMLNVGYNDLGVLAEDTFRGLGNVTTLVLRSIHLTVLPAGLFHHTPQLLSLDLSGNPLHSVPTAALLPLTRLQSLGLRSAQLNVVVNHSFPSLCELRELFLDNNSLVSLQPEAFSGLSRLQTLNLTSNSLALDHRSLPPGVFKPLAALQNLGLNGNDYRDVGHYPLNVFDPLQSLQYLSIDTFRKARFGEAFSSLTQLSSLSIAGNGCNLKFISNDTFAAFRHSGLSTLTIYDCIPVYIEKCAFCHLPNLTSLKVVGWHKLPLSYSLQALYGLQNQSMELIDFSRSRGFMNFLDGTTTAFLNNICVQTVSLRRCRIFGLLPGAFPKHGTFLRCLQHLDLSENALAAVTKKMVFRLMAGVSSLQSLRLENQHNFILNHPTPAEAPRPEDRPSKYSEMTICIYFPPTLRSLKLSAAITNLSQLPFRLHVKNGGNLTEIDLSYCGAYDFRLSLTGLTHLLTLDISGNDCYLMSTSLFQNLTTLRRLRLAASHLSQDFLLHNGTDLLRPLEALEEMDLSSNDLNAVQRSMLQQHSNLKRLSLAGNHFQTVPLDLPETGALSELDMRDNKMTSLPAPLRHRLDRLANRRPFLLRLRGNPFSCTCDTLDMIDWLGTTDVRLDGDVDAAELGFDDDYDDNGRDYPCVREDGSRSSTGSMFAQRESHWRHCVGLGFLAVAVAALLVQLLGLLLVYVLWRNWTYVRYTWNVLRRLRLPRRQDFQHDAVLLHADRDLELALRVRGYMQEAVPAQEGGVEVKLPIEVIPLPSIYAEELAKCIQDSWRIVVMVTAHFLQDQWSGLAVQQTQLGLTDTMPDRVLLLDMMHDHQQQQQQQQVDPGVRPSPVSLQRLIRMLPESNVFHVPITRLRRRRRARRLGGDGGGDNEHGGGGGVGGGGGDADERRVSPRHPAWATLAQRIARDH